MKKISIASDSKASGLFLQADRFEEAGQFKKAFRCFAEAAKLGHASSQLNLGNYYAMGTGVQKSYADAEYWYKRAFRNGNTTAARNLAIDKLALGNVRAAVRWLKRGVEKKDGGSYLLLARVYCEQRGGKQKAVRLLRRVAALSRDYASQLDKENAQALLAEIASK